MSVASDENQDELTMMLKESSKASLTMLYGAHGDLQEARYVLQAYSNLDVLEPVESNGTRPKAIQFFSKIDALRVEALSLAREYKKSCEQRISECNVVHQQQLRVLHDAVGANTDVGRRLPREIVGYIFAWCLGENSPLDVLDLCRVSSKWRAIALSTPSLWTHLSIDTDQKLRRSNLISSDTMDCGGPEFDISLIDSRRPSLNSCYGRSHGYKRTKGYLRHPAHVQEWIARAGALPLHVRLKWKVNFHIDTFPEWRKALAILRPRLHSLVVLNKLAEDPFSELFVSSSLIDRSFPHLRVLDLMKTYIEDCRLRRFRFDAPNMHTLRFARGYFDGSDKAIDWSSVPNLHSIGTTEDGLLMLLSQVYLWGSNPSQAQAPPPLVLNIQILRSLTLKLPPFSDQNSDATAVAKTLRQHPAVFASLRELTIEMDSSCPTADSDTSPNGDVLCAIRAPDLHALTVRRVVNAEVHLGAMLGTPQAPRCAKLAILNLDKIQFKDAKHSFKPLFRAVPSLTELHLRQMSVHTILRALSRDSDGVEDQSGYASNNNLEGPYRKTVTFLPNLQILTLRHVTKKVKSDSLLMSLMRYRGLVGRLGEYPAQADGRCVPLQFVTVQLAGDGCDIE